MSTYVTSQQFVRSAAVVFVMLAVAAAVVESRRGEDATVLAPLEPGEADALAQELARCRTVTPDDASALEACRRIWAENRQHFFVSTKSPQPVRICLQRRRSRRTKNRIPQQEVDQRRSR